MNHHTSIMLTASEHEAVSQLSDRYQISISAVLRAAVHVLIASPDAYEAYLTAEQSERVKRNRSTRKPRSHGKKI